MRWKTKAKSKHINRHFDQNPFKQKHVNSKGLATNFPVESILQFIRTENRYFRK